MPVTKLERKYPTKVQCFCFEKQELTTWLDSPRCRRFYRPSSSYVLAPQVKPKLTCGLPLKMLKALSWNSRPRPVSRFRWENYVQSETLHSIVALKLIWRSSRELSLHWPGKNRFMSVFPVSPTAFMLYSKHCATNCFPFTNICLQQYHWQYTKYFGSIIA